MPFDSPADLFEFGMDHPLAPKRGGGSAHQDRSADRLPTYFVVPSVGSLPHQPQTRLMPMVEWEGTVETVDWDKGEFTARLREVAQADRAIEYGTFSIDEVDQDDLDLLRSGGIFRWVIGKRENSYRRIENTSKLMFRRLPGYSFSDLLTADAQAEAWAASIKVR